MPRFFPPKHTCSHTYLLVLRALFSASSSEALFPGKGLVVVAFHWKAPKDEWALKNQRNESGRVFIWLAPTSISSNISMPVKRANKSIYLLHRVVVSWPVSKIRNNGGHMVRAQDNTYCYYSNGSKEILLSRIGLGGSLLSIFVWGCTNNGKGEHISERVWSHSSLHGSPEPRAPWTHNDLLAHVAEWQKGK